MIGIPTPPILSAGFGDLCAHLMVESDTTLRVQLGQLEFAEVIAISVDESDPTQPRGGAQA